MSAAGQSAPASRARRCTPSIVRLTPQFVNRVCIHRQQLAHVRDRAESGSIGFLFGTVAEHLVNVQEMRPLSDDDCGRIYSDHSHPRDVFEKLLAGSKTDPELSGLNLVGWYSTRSQTGLRDSDIEFHNRYFRRASDLAVMLKAEQNSDLSAELYARTLRARFSADTHRRASLRVSIHEPPTTPLQVAIPGPTSDHVSTTARVPASEASFASTAALRSQRLWWIRLGVAAALVVAALSLWEMKFGKGTAGVSALRTTPPDAGIDLDASRRGDALLVSWNRQSPAVRSATEATLRIQDGSQQHQLRLDRVQIAKGTVVYNPTSGDVLFRLELKGEYGTNVESTRVLDGWKLDLAGSRLPNASGASVQPENSEQHVYERGRTTDMRSKSDRIVRTPASSSLNLQSSGPLSFTPVTPPFVPLLQAGFSDQTKIPSSVPKGAVSAAEGRPSQTTQIATIPHSAAPQITAPPRTVVPQPRMTGSHETPQSNPVASTAAPRPSVPALAPTPSENVSATYIPPRPVKEVMPETQSIRALVYRVVDITVEVSIDENGRVIAARTTKNDPDVNLALVGAAISAAKQWRYEPASLHGRYIASRQTIVFQIHPRQ